MSRPKPLLTFPRRQGAADLHLGPAGEKGRIDVLTAAMIEADANARLVGAKPGWVKLTITFADGLAQAGYFLDRDTAAQGFQIACVEDAKARAAQ
jgi:hypothetical protein